MMTSSSYELYRRTIPMVPGGQGCLATSPWRVFGQLMSDITMGLQYSMPMLGSLEDGDDLVLTSGTLPSSGG